MEPPKKPIPISKQKLIYLKWQDAHSQSGWHTKSQIEKLINEDVCLCEEVGWVFYEDKKEIFLAARRLVWREQDFQGETSELGLLQRIPKAWILDRKTIKV